MLDAIFGGLSSSRLFQAVREERGLAYSVYSFSGQYADTGQIGLYVGTRPDKVGEAMRVVGDELARLREARRRRRSSSGRSRTSRPAWCSPRSRRGARMNRLGAVLLFGLPLLEVDELVERFDAVTLDDLRELTAELWAPERLSAAGIGPDEDAFRAARSQRLAASRGERRREQMIRVAVAGAAGRMGAAVCAAVKGAEDLALTGRADPALGVAVPAVLGEADVLVDFTRPDTALENARLRSRPASTSSSARTGFDAASCGTPRRGTARSFVAPNFAIGAVLMMRFAAEASRLHGQAPRSSSSTTPAKLDAPSGTAKRTAELMDGDVPIHSVRLPGIVADQEVILGDRPDADPPPRDRRTARASCPAC